MTNQHGARVVEVTLLPCPFCGGEKLIQAMTSATADFAYWSVECAGCGVEVADDESQAAADKHWNTRQTSTAALEAEIGRLREAATDALKLIERLRTSGKWLDEVTPASFAASVGNRLRLALAHQETNDE